MTREKLFAWVLDTYGTEPDYPWQDGAAVLRHRESGKWYALVMDIPAKKLGLTGEDHMDVMNVKCDPLLIGSLRQQPGFFPAYHMNKDSWLTVALDGTVSEKDIRELIGLSYLLTRKKGKR